MCSHQPRIKIWVLSTYARSIRFHPNLMKKRSFIHFKLFPEPETIWIASIEFISGRHGIKHHRKNHAPTSKTWFEVKSFRFRVLYSKQKTTKKWERKYFLVTIDFWWEGNRIISHMLCTRCKHVEYDKSRFCMRSVSRSAVSTNRKRLPALDYSDARKNISMCKPSMQIRTNTALHGDVSK